MIRKGKTRDVNLRIIKQMTASSKILILSCNTGEGHNACAGALKHSFEKNGSSCDVLDALSLRGMWISNMISGLYGFSIRNSLFSKVYGAAEWFGSRKRKSPVYHLCGIFAKKLHELITERQYDAVICTHLFPAETLTVVKRKYGLNVPTFHISTDYTCYPLLNETDLDGYMIAHPELEDEYVSKGIPSDKIYQTGIPCMDDTAAKVLVKMEARQMFETVCDGKWFLIMGGSMGFGNMSDLVENLLKDSCPNDRIICVCGRNSKQKQELDKRYHDKPSVKVIGYTDRIAELMTACDVLFTKPGGLTSTEALIRNIPIIHTEPIKGVEDKNAAFFHIRNMSFSSTHPYQQAETAHRLCNDLVFREAMTDAQRLHRREDACLRTINIIKNHIQR